MAEGLISAEDLRGVYEKTGLAIADLRVRLSASKSQVLDVDAAIEPLTHLLWNTSMVWQTSDLQGKQKIQRRVLPKGLRYAKTGFGTL